MKCFLFKYPYLLLCFLVGGILELKAQQAIIENLEVVWLEQMAQVKASFLIGEDSNEIVLVRFFAGEEACTLEEIFASTDMYVSGQTYEVLFDIPRPDLFKITVENLEAPNIQTLVDQVNVDSLYNTRL